MKAVFLLCAALSVGAGAPPPQDDPPAPCIAYWGEARYVLGYNHLVHIVNACTADAVCSVSTDVNPREQIVTVAAGTHVVVTTYLGAATPRFVPFVRCTLGAR